MWHIVLHTICLYGDAEALISNFKQNRINIFYLVNGEKQNILR